MKTITLSQDKSAKVDDDWFDYLSQFKWYAYRNRNSFYAARNSGVRPFRIKIRMHTEIMNPPHGMEVDHIDGDGLNNQIGNLRIVTKAQNRANSSRNLNNTSGFKGVSWYKRSQKWRAVILINGKYVHIGLFDSAEDAARAYDETARKYHGEFARLNFNLDIPSK